ncbi:MAG: hypothetical protein U1E70_08325 [Acetobacteraceae bacterium]
MPFEVGFQDQARAGQQGLQEYIWALVGSRPCRCTVTATIRCIYLAPCSPRAPPGPAIIMPAANKEAMSKYLNDIVTQVAPGAPAALVCHGAGWYQHGKKYCKAVLDVDHLLVCVGVK